VEVDDTYWAAWIKSSEKLIIKIFLTWIKTIFEKIPW
jgi:hypothetical protein